MVVKYFLKHSLFYLTLLEKAAWDQLQDYSTVNDDAADQKSPIGWELIWAKEKGTLFVP